MAESRESLNRQAATTSLATNTAVACLKFAAAIVTGSVSLLSEAFHSGTDAIAALVAFLSIRAAAVPPDEDHPYGHGKIESLSEFGEGVLLLGISGLIFVQAVMNLIRGAHPEKLDLGLAAMGASAVIALGLGRYLVGVSAKTDSVALRANGRHMLLDFCTSLVVFAALSIQRLTGFLQADAILGLGLAAWLAYSGWKMASDAFQQLIDRRVTDDELGVIASILSDTPGLMSYHRLRTRHSGNVHYVDLHAVVPNDWSVVQAHKLADGLEKRIATALSPAQVVIHIDPFDPQKAGRDAE